ncbi:phage tail protein [Lysobacter gummosus]|uniref:Phage tail protein n=1 Tax=Lysobacter gummosus TaxID=262324 RepID=A0ABY3X804_9GAMM|nr:phage tail protein [Lysobacter gummosus]ALN92515.1 P2 phage tail completion R family protein [Lysobacter gummosus]UNP28090.1 phage tail protein [Lysobacter gummosus]
MNKPASLRAHLAKAIPELQRNPESLLVFVEEGSLISTAQTSESFELRYRLSLVLVDFVGDANRLFLAVLRWAALHQNELLANPDRRGDIAFEVDVIDHERADVEIRLPLTERIGVLVLQNGEDRITPWPEPKFDPESWCNFGMVP